jgi:hypothetical protein
MKGNNDLLISFPDSSKSFTYGVEFGRLLQKMEQGDDVVLNNGFPIRVENVELLNKTCAYFGYVPSYGDTFYDEWIEFLAIKKVSNDN